MGRRFISLILMVFLIFSISYAQTTSFKDVPANHWAAEAVKYLTDLGIISGIRPDTFAGDTYVTRYQVAVLLYKLIQALQSGKIALPAADVSELKELVSQLQDELQLIGANVEDLMSALQDLDSRVSDLEAALSEKVGVEDVENIVSEKLSDVTARMDDLEASLSEKVGVEDVENIVSEALSDVNARLDDLEAKIEAIEKVEVTPEQIEAVIGEKFEELLEAKISEKIGDLESRVTDLEGFVTDLDSRLADVEAALVDKPSLDEVQAMIEEKIAEIPVPDVEELTSRVTDLEGFVTDLDSRLADVEAALVDKPSLDEVQAMIEEKMAEVAVPDVEELTGKVTDLEDRVSTVETRLDDVDSAISDLMSSIDDLNANLVDLSEKVDEVLALKDQLDELIARIESIQGIEIPVELDEIKSFVTDLDSKVSDLAVAIDDLNTLVSDLQSQIDEVNAKVDEINTSIENVNSSIDALATSVDDLYVLNDGVSERLNETVDRVSALESKVADLEKKASEKNFTLTLQFGAKKVFGTGKDMKVTDAYVRQIALNLSNLDFGISSLSLVYDKYGSFAPDNYGLVVDLPYFQVKATAKVAGLTLSAGFSNDDVFAAKLSGSLSGVNYNLYGMFSIVSGAYNWGPVGADVSYEIAKGITVFADGYYNDAKFAALAGVTLDGLLPNTSVTLKGVYKNTFGLYAEVNTSLMKNFDASVIVDVPDFTKLDKDNVSVTLYGSYKVNEKLTLWGYATNNESGMWYGTTLDPTTASALYVEADYVPVSGVTLALSAYKSALPTITTAPYPDFVSFSTKVKF